MAERVQASLPYRKKGARVEDAEFGRDSGLTMISESPKGSVDLGVGWSVSLREEMSLVSLHPRGVKSLTV